MAYLMTPSVARAVRQLSVTAIKEWCNGRNMRNNRHVPCQGSNLKYACSWVKPHKYSARIVVILVAMWNGLLKSIAKFLCHKFSVLSVLCKSDDDQLRLWTNVGPLCSISVLIKGLVIRHTWNLRGWTWMLSVLLIPQLPN